MTDAAEPTDLELAALMCSRLCHDVIGPIGAIANGFEVLEDEKDEEMRQMALDVIRKNADKASSRLQFLRLAFGAMGGAGDRFPLEDARKLTESLFDGEKVRIAWPASADALPKDQVKLLVNLVLTAAQAIPRGGEVSVAVEPAGESARFRLTASGVNAAVPKPAGAIFSGELPEGRVDAHSIQPFYTARLARSVGMTVGFESGEGAVAVVAEPTAEPAI